MLTSVRRALAVPAEALQRTSSDPRLVRLQLSWAAVVVGHWTAVVSLSVVAFSEGGSAAVALAVLARTLAGVVGAPVVGALVDRVPRQRCLLAAAALAALASAAAAVGASALPAAAAVVTAVVLVTAVGLATTLFRTAQSVLLPELVDAPSDLLAANVLSGAVKAVGVFAGPALAAALLTAGGPALAFGVCTGLHLVAAGLVVGLPRRAHAGASGRTGSAGGTGEVLRLPAARLVLGLLLAQSVLTGALVVLYPALAVESLHLDVSAVGMLNAAYGLGGLLCSVGLFALAGSRRLGGLSAGALLLRSLPLLLLPLPPPLTVVLGLLAVVGAGNVLLDVAVVTLLQRAVPGRLLGRAFGAVETTAVVGLGVGAVLAPASDDLVGPAASVALLACALAVVALVAVPALRRLDRELAAPVRQVALLQALPAASLLPPLERERLALQLRRFPVATGEVVARQGEPGTAWYLVDGGRLRVEVDGRHVRDLVAGDSFGEVALLRDGVRTATVRAEDEGVLWRLDGEAFLAVLRADGGRALAALEALADENLSRAAPGPR